MLKEFKVKNFMSFKEEISFRFDQVRDYGFSKKCIKNGLVNKALIFGENSSGKTNLTLAMMDISLHLFDGAICKVPEENYLNLDSTESEATFSYVFLFGTDEIEYTYRKKKPFQLTFEQLKKNGTLLCEFNFSTHKYINNVPEISTLKFENNTSDMSMVKFIYNNSQLSSDSPIRLVVEFAKNMLWFHSVRGFDFISPNINRESINDYLIQNDLVNDLQTFLHKRHIDLKLTTVSSFNSKVIAVQYENGIAPLSSVASTGTMSLWLFFYWMHKNKSISFLIIDEFDAFFHYELSKDIISLVNQNSSFQTVLTSHNTYLIDNDIMRPDCYFMLKNQKIASFANSTNKVIRQGHNLEKMMISGEFD